MGEIEPGHKWWIRYVIVPLCVAVIGAVLIALNHSTGSVYKVPPQTTSGEEEKTLILSRPLPQGVTFSNFAGEVFEDAQGDEPPNQQVGAGWLRNKSATWPNVTPGGSSCGTFNWGGTSGMDPDQDVLTAHSQGQEYLLNLAYTAQCAYSAACLAIQGADCSHYAPGKLTDWTDYVNAAVARYSAPPFNVKYFQIWNEPGDPTNLFWQVADRGNPGQEFVDQIYNPAASIIHSYGREVVFSGWTCDINNSKWTTCEQDLNSWLNYNGAGSNTDYIDVHYAPPYVWQYLYANWVATGKVKGLWQSEIGGTFSTGLQPGELPPTYLTAMYWALSSGGWNASSPDKYKFFWFPGFGGPPAALTTAQSGGPLSVLSPHGTYHAVLKELLDGGNLAAFSGYSSNLPSYPATNGSVGLSVGQHQVVIALFPTTTNYSMSVSVPLSTEARSVTFIDAAGNPVENSSYSQGGGVLHVFGNSGSSLSPAYLLKIQF